MKNKADQHFEDQFRSKLSTFPAGLPEKGFESIRRGWLARKRKRMVLRAMLLLLFLIGLMSWWWWPAENVSVDPHHPKTAVKKEQGLVSAVPKEKKGLADADIKTSPSTREEEMATNTNTRNEPQAPAPVRQKKSEEVADFAKSQRNNSPSKKPIVLSGSTAETEESKTPVDSNKQDKKEIKPGDEDVRTWISAMPKLDYSTSPLPYSRAINPGFSIVYQPVNDQKKKWRWEFSLAPGLHFYHLTPNRGDEVHYYSFDDPEQDFNLSLSEAVYWSFTPKFSAGLNVQYQFTNTHLRLHSLEKSFGSGIFFQAPKQKDTLYYKDYRQRTDELSGQFHQLGFGAQARYRLLSAGKLDIDAQGGLNYLFTLNPEEERFFPTQEIQFHFTMGFRRPLGPNWALSLRPRFTYGWSAGPSSGLVQMERMIFGLGIAVGYE